MNSLMTDVEWALIAHSPHLWQGKNYHAMHPLPAYELMRLAEGKNLTWKRRFYEAVRRAGCWFLGHDMVLDRWCNAKNSTWYETGDYEIHIGCRRCSHLLVVPATYEWHTQKLALTPSMVRNFWSYMTFHFKSNVAQKKVEALKCLAALMLESPHFKGKSTFLLNTPMSFDNTVYVPFFVGEEEPYWPSWLQIRTCVHEHQHIIQGQEEGWATRDIRYLTKSAARAQYEAEAYACDMQLEFWRLGASFSFSKFIDERSLILRSYGCGPNDIRKARRYLIGRAYKIGKGEIESSAAQKALEWLVKHAPGLKMH